MRNVWMAAATIAGLTLTAVPASAQFYAGAGPGGAGVQVGPFGAGVGPAYGWHDRYYDDGYATDGYYASRSGCRVVRERTETPSGRMIIRTRRICD